MIAWSSRFDGLNQNWALQEVQHLTCWRHDHQQYVGLELFLATWQPLPSALFSFSSTFSLSSPTFGSSSPAPSLYRTGISHLHWLQIVFPSNFLFNFIGRAYLHVRRVSGSITTRYRVCAKSHRQQFHWFVLWPLTRRAPTSTASEVMVNRDCFNRDVQISSEENFVKSSASAN